MAHEQTSILFSDDVYYKLYNAEIGDVIEGRHYEIDDSGNFVGPVERQYRKLEGAFEADDSRWPATDGLLYRFQFYQLVFKDLSDGVIYLMSTMLDPAPAPEGIPVSNRFYFYPPSSDSTEIRHEAVTATRFTKSVHVYVPSGGPN